MDTVAIDTAFAPRVMNGANPTLSESIVQRVMKTCRQVDHNAKLVTCTRDTRGTTHLRIRAGDVHSVSSLQKALEDAMPLSTASVEESWIDGTLEAEITVFSAAEEYRRARKVVTQRRAFAYWILLSWVLILLGVGEWAFRVRSEWKPPSPHDEL